LDTWSFATYGLIFFLKETSDSPIHVTARGRSEKYLNWRDYLIAILEIKRIGRKEAEKKADEACTPFHSTKVVKTIL
jgi:hypothetical protein